MPEPKRPFSGRAYGRGFANVERVKGMLSLVDCEIAESVIAAWSDEERICAYDWAFRSHLRASDNLNRVPPMPECVMLIEAGYEAREEESRNGVGVTVWWLRGKRVGRTRIAAAHCCERQAEIVKACAFLSAEGYLIAAAPVPDDPAMFD